MTDELEQPDPRHTSPFDAIKHMSEEGSEYWSARELAKLLGYKTNFRNFQKAIEKAKEACEQSGQAVSDHIAHVRNMIPTGKGAMGHMKITRRDVLHGNPSGQT